MASKETLKNKIPNKNSFYDKHPFCRPSGWLRHSKFAHAILSGLAQIGSSSLELPPGGKETSLRSVVGLHDSSEQRGKPKCEESMPLVIVAGGKGTRLGLQDIPKPMVPIAGKPLLEHQIILAKHYGITDIFILSGHLAKVIFDYFKDGSDWGVNITHILEPYPLGTAGSVKLLEHIIKERFLVLYGDVVLDFDMQSFIEYDKKNASLATIITHPNDHPFDSDLVEIDTTNRVTSFLTKPHQSGLLYKNCVNAAAYIFSPEIFKFIPFGANQDFGKNIFPRLIAEQLPIYAYQTPEYIKDLGTLDRLEKVQKDFTSGKIARMNKKHPRKAIFSDRDGVINRELPHLTTIEEFEMLPEVPEAIKKINQSEYLAIVITNQPVIAKGFVTESQLNKIHKKMETLLGEKHAYIDGLYYCPHHPEKGFEGEIKELKIQCNCRKPEAGMLHQAAKDFNIDLKNSWMIGDRDADILAGKKAGCKTVMLPNSKPQQCEADFHCQNLSKAVDHILTNQE